MSLSVGTRLGPYEILAPIGAGGMGEVYRARDTRLGRDVAVKVLPSYLSSDPERLRRFEQEARAAGILNHPNILTIYDVGTHEQSPYVVSELLEGETLRERLSSAAISPRKAIDYGLQMAHGLAAAHEKGIVHRDLKPENLFLTKSGHLKILDFGLAKLSRPEGSAEGVIDGPTFAPDTKPGMVLGTVGYMSPEQIRGEIVNHRSDIFSFGTILYELLSGKRAFRGDSAVETLNAILKDDPPDFWESNRNIPPGIERVVRHCLEKKPEERFQSARDLAFALEALSGLSGSGPAVALTSSARAKLHPGRLAMTALMIVVLALGVFVIGERFGQSPIPSFQRLTFQHGTIRSARFAPDGQTIIYGASWEGDPIQLFMTRPETPESRALGLRNADILSISSNGKMAVLLGGGILGGTLAQVPLAGGAPREILEHAQEADWAANGNTLAVVRSVAGRTRLESPIGKVLCETAGNISHPRISPRGDRVAFLEHSVYGDDRGAVSLVDFEGKKKTLTREWSSIQGLAWVSPGDEIWFTASEAGYDYALYAVTLSGRQRLIMRVVGGVALQDVSREGRALMTREYLRTGMIGLTPGDSKERDLDWLDGSEAADLSTDGKTLLFTEAGEGGGANHAVYLRKTDGSPAVRLGEGTAMALSPDGKWALSISHSSHPQLVLLPTGAGDAQYLSLEDISEYHWADWLADGKRILFAGNAPGHGVRCYVLNLEDNKIRPVTPEGTRSRGIAISPDGKYFTALGPDQKGFLYPIGDGQPQLINGLTPGDIPIRWGADGHSLYVYRFGKLPAKIFRLDLSTGHKELWKEIKPSDPAGISGIETILLTPDARSYVYTYERLLSDLYLVEGLR